MRMIFQNGYDDITIYQVNQLCQERFGTDIELDKALPSLHLDIETVSSVAGLIVGANGQRRAPNPFPQHRGDQSLPRCRGKRSSPLPHADPGSCPEYGNAEGRNFEPSLGRCRFSEASDSGQEDQERSAPRGSYDRLAV